MGKDQYSQIFRCLVQETNASPEYMSTATTIKKNTLMKQLYVWA
jgi:hypothetical protein